MFPAHLESISSQSLAELGLLEYFAFQVEDCSARDRSLHSVVETVAAVVVALAITQVGLQLVVVATG